MKKSVIALAVLGAASSFAFAASSVTLYGKIDQSVVVSKAKGDDTVTQMYSGFNAGSRFGIRGNEDLGNGYSVGFQLEQGFNSDTGAASNSSNAFNRQSTLHVQGAFGRVAFGRMGALTSGTGSYSLTDGSNIDPMGYGYSIIGAANKNAFIDTGRLNNAVVYVSPNFSGVTLSAMYSNGTSEDTAAWDKNSHYYGIGAKYASRGLNGVAVFEMFDNDGIHPKDMDEPPAAGGLARGNVYVGTIGAAYDFGAIKPFIGLQYVQQKDVAKQGGALVGFTAPVAGGSLSLSAKYLDGKFTGKVADEYFADKKKDFDILSIAAAYQYPLSKRTFVYGFAGYAAGADRYKNAERAETLSEYFKYGTTGANANGWAAAVGIQHNF